MDNTKRITGDTILYNLLNLKQVTFEVTDECNLKCKYCGFGEMYTGYDIREAKYLSFNNIKPLIDYLCELWNTNLSDSSLPITFFSFYGGEPLLNMDFIKQTVEYIEKLNIRRKILFSMTTNAMLLDRYMDYLVEKGFHLLISLDGDSHGDSYRVDKCGRSSFERVMRNVKRLQTNYPKYFADNVNFNSVLHNRNSVQSIHNFISGEFGKTPRIAELNSAGVRPEMLEEFNQSYKNKLESLYESQNYEAITESLFTSDPNTHDLLIYLHQYSGNVFGDFCDLFMNPQNECRTPTGTCTPFSKKMFITVNGKILQCERIDHLFSLGLVSSDGVQLNLDRIADAHNAYLDKMQNQCSACHRKRSCSQCLFYIDSIREEKPKCHGFMNENDFKKHSTRCMKYLYDHPDLYKRLMTDVIFE